MLTQRITCSAGRFAFYSAAGEESLISGLKRESTENPLSMSAHRERKNSLSGIRKLKLLRCTWHSYRRRSELRCRHVRS